MFAIVDIAKKQFIVSPGDVITVPHFDGEVGTKVVFDSVLLVSDDKGVVTIGKPMIKGASVKATIKEQTKGEKIEVKRYKQKVRYRRHRGFRPVITRLSIDSI